ncbi:hypothetical protein B0H13DRAFT_1869708 [Mycena leptocephala]|nr:hypothetical protein B0H13DRAFT_1869708 [Mycena leptocephala]
MFPVASETNFEVVAQLTLTLTLDFIRNVLNPGVLRDIYLEDAPYTWMFLSVFTTSPNKWCKQRAWTGKDGKPATPLEHEEWEESEGGGAEESTEFAGEMGGFWTPAATD